VLDKCQLVIHIPWSHTVHSQNDISQGTSDLALRIGLNSGPTTAGVLRGEKARFQLFGDVSSQQVLFHSALDQCNILSKYRSLILQF
jgi:Adenylate and Guanylate cyclase catalytic domain